MPSPSDSTDTSAATPIVIPSVDSNVRSGFVRSVSKPTRSEEAAIRSSMSLGGFGKASSPYGRSRGRFQQAGREEGGGRKEERGRRRSFLLPPSSFLLYLGIGLSIESQPYAAAIRASISAINCPPASPFV